MPKTKAKRTYLLIQEVIKTYNIAIEADSQEEAANIGMAIPIKKWIHPPDDSSILTDVQLEPIGNSVVKYKRQKWGKHKDRWVRRKLTRRY